VSLYFFKVFILKRYYVPCYIICICVDWKLQYHGKFIVCASTLGNKALTLKVPALWYLSVQNIFANRQCKNEWKKNVSLQKLM